MATPVTATLDANEETCGPLVLIKGQEGLMHIAITGTITVTLQRRANGSWISVTDAAYTASVTTDIVGAGVYQLIASATSGGSAVCMLAVAT